MLILCMVIFGITLRFLWSRYKNGDNSIVISYTEVSIMELEAKFSSKPDIKLVTEALIELANRTYKKKPQKEQPSKKSE